MPNHIKKEVLYGILSVIVVFCCCCSLNTLGNLLLLMTYVDIPANYLDTPNRMHRLERVWEIILVTLFKTVIIPVHKSFLVLKKASIYYLVFYSSLVENPF